jgi:hypothetical protein
MVERSSCHGSVDPEAVQPGRPWIARLAAMSVHEPVARASPRRCRARTNIGEPAQLSAIKKFPRCEGHCNGTSANARPQLTFDDQATATTQ